MPTYSCLRCGKAFIRPSELERHANRKYPCVASTPTPKPERPSGLSCPKCGRCFQHQSSMYRHRNTCKAEPPAAPSREDQMGELLAAFKEFLPEMLALRAATTSAVVPAGAAAAAPPQAAATVQVEDHSVTNMVTATQNNTVNINLTTPLRPYGQEDLTLFDARIHEIVAMSRDDGIAIVTALAQERWNNPQTPWNSNVSIPNKADGVPRVFNGKTWEPRSKEELYPDMAQRVIQAADEAQSKSFQTPFFKAYGPRLRSVFDDETRMKAGGTFARETRRAFYPHVLAATERLRDITGTRPGAPLPTAVPAPTAALDMTKKTCGLPGSQVPVETHFG